MFDASTLSLFAQIPLVLIFVLFTLHILKLYAAERKDRDESWQALFTRADDTQTKIAGDVVSAIREFAQEHREGLAAQASEARAAEARLVEGQGHLRRGNAKVAALIVAKMTELDADAAKNLVREILAD